MLRRDGGSYWYRKQPHFLENQGIYTRSEMAHPILTRTLPLIQKPAEKRVMKRKEQSWEGEREGEREDRSRKREIGREERKAWGVSGVEGDTR